MNVRRNLGMCEGTEEYIERLGIVWRTGDI